MNDNQKVMRVHVSEDKSFKVSAKKKNNIISLVTVGQTYYTLQHPLAGPIEKKETKGLIGKRLIRLIIYDSTRKPISVIVSLYIFYA